MKRKTPPPGPWHVELLHKKPEDPRRDCRKCVYYTPTNKKCRFYGYKCFGSSQCKYYREYPSIQKSQKELFLTPSRKEYLRNQLLKNGTKVIHKINGAGMVQRLWDDKVQIKFSIGYERMYSVEELIESGNIEIL